MSKTESHSRLSGRPSVPNGSWKLAICQKHTATRNPPVLETVTPYRPRNPVSIRCYHRISTSFQPIPAPSTWRFRHLSGETTCQRIYSGREEPFLSAQQNVIFRLPEHGAARIGCANRAQADTEDYRSQKIYWRFLRKRSNPSRNAAPEFSPVAGASFCTFL